MSMEVINLLDDSSDESISNDNGRADKDNQKASGRQSSASHHLRQINRPKKPYLDPDEDEVISISSGTEDSVSNDDRPSKTCKGGESSVNSDSGKIKAKDNAPRRHRRRADGYHLKKGERIVWATEKGTRDEKGKSHEAIILHPQPDPPSPNYYEGMVCVRWLISRVEAWIPKSNIESQICSQNDGLAEKQPASDDSIEVVEVRQSQSEGGDGKQNDAVANNNHKFPKRKRLTPNRYVDTFEEVPKLACEREDSSQSTSKSKKGGITCCTNVETCFRTKRAKLPRNVRSAIAIAHTTMLMKSSKEDMKKQNFFEHEEGVLCNDNEPETKIPAQAKRQKLGESQGGHSVPITVVSYEDDCSSVSSTVTLELPDSDSETDLSSEQDDISGCEEDSNLKVATSHLECHICDSRVHYHNQINKMLQDFKGVINEQDSGKSRYDFVARFKVLLQGLEDDGQDGANIFYHSCEGSKASNPTLTVAMLIQLFDHICQIIPMVFAGLFRKEINSSLMQLLFRPWRKSSPKDCGVVIQMLRISTFEIVNSREDYVRPENPQHIDNLVGVTFGLQALQTMARNAYSNAKAKFQDNPTGDFGFLDQPLESYKSCIRRNCQVDHRDRRPKVMCKICGVRFHKCCFSTSENADDKMEKLCTSCEATELLFAASRNSNLSDIASLLVKKGASPLQPLSSDMARNESYLHVAVRSNNYDLTSMLLFGAYLLLNCDDSLQNWDLPEIAWGKDNKAMTPFNSGIDIIIKNMDMRPPVEILLLLTGRGAQESQENIRRALETRHRMMLVMNGLDDKQALLKADASMGLEPIQIPAVSNSGLPEFVYVAKPFESRSTAVRWFDCRYGRRNQLVPFEGKCTLESRKTLHRKQNIQASWRTYCNYLCKCRAKQTLQDNEKCDCRLAENGLHHGLEVFQTSDGRGFGVRTAKGVIIRKNEVLCHYAGEIITSQEAKRRDQEYYADSHKGSYILDIDEKGQYCIDATNFRSAAAFINHSCSESNCELFRALGNHLDANFPHLGICAKNDIGELTELQFNYIKGSFGEKPESFCQECKTVHCLCQQCKKAAHGM